MEVPTRHPSARGLPSIYIDGGRPAKSFGGLSRNSGFSSRFSPTLSAIPPMSIPGSGSRSPDPPPPLPPPRYLDEQQPPAAFGGDHNRDFSGSIGGSLYGSMGASPSDERPNYKSRGQGHAVTTDRDEGYASISSTRSRESLPTGFGMSHERFQFRSTGDSYDKSFDSSMLDRLNTRRGTENRSPPRRSGFSSSAAADSASAPASDRFPPALKPLSLPTRTKQPMIVDSPSRYTETPLSSAISPRGAPFGQAMDYRSPSTHDMVDLERSPVPRSQRTNSLSVRDDATVSPPGTTYETNGEDRESPMEETTRLSAIQLEERAEFHGAGQKRRASSPPGDDPPPPLASEILRRREGGGAPSRGSPTPRLTLIPHGSVSSVSSAGRSTPYTTLTMTTSSLTSMGSASFGRRSPGALSPGGMSPTETTAWGSPFATPMSLTTSPRSSLSRTTVASQPVQPQRAMSDHQQIAHAAAPPGRATLASPRKLTDVPPKASSVAKMQGFLMCDCCPKKPKKFETDAELRAHELEKQYECSFCGNRFKNKNEAERHQNSLHVRRHSWSCSALTGYERAFHESTTRPGEADACGYCGEEFSRTGTAAGGGARFITDQDWEERVHHLQEIHKFRECNSSKKFYRADHFRQHLKHSHAGTSGKWTNMLENACMLEEDPPLPR